MGKSLLIVESPTKVKTLKKIVGKDFIVKASVGHLKDLPKKKLGVDVENGFAPDYITIRGKGKILAELKAAAKKVDTIYLAPDPDREGEAIAHHINTEVSRFSKTQQIYRVSFNEITKRAVLEALKNPTQLNANKVDAQQARRILDRLVGYKISPILWKKVQRGLSAGRVQSVALRIVCDREQEIKSFKPEEYWTVTIDVEGSQEPVFPAKLFKIDNEKAEIPNQETVDAILKNIKGREFLLNDIVKKERKRNPNAPFITSSLQQDASSKLNFSPKKTMMLAQRLYEGMELGKKGAVGLITYMRTDSTRIAQEALEDVRGLIGSRYGEKYVPKSPNFYKSKKSAQDAHEAIRPTDVAIDPASVKEYLEKDLFMLYELIWVRFVASQMIPSVLDTTQFDIECGNYIFRANGSTLKLDGFIRVYLEASDKRISEGILGADRLLPELKTGEILKLLKIEPEQHFTQPPPRFTEASLVKTLEDKGIGRPSTYASIISVIKDRDYIKSEDRKLFPSELGDLVSELLVENFPDIMNEEFTADLENKLDQIEEGSAQWVNILQDFYGPFEKDLEQAEKKMRDVKGKVEETDEVCEKCAKPMVIKWGRFGKFMACTGYPECKTTKEIDGGDKEKSGINEPVEGTCEKCDSPLVMKIGRFGKFIACSDYPACKFTRPITLGIPCPEKDCKGSVLARKSKKGRAFYGCSEYPNCKYVSWDKPVAEACPTCGSSTLVEKWKKNEGKFIICKSEGCDYKKSDEAA